MNQSDPISRSFYYFILLYKRQKITLHRFTLCLTLWLGHLTRGYTVLFTIVPITQMPPLILYDDKMIQFKGCGGTSHTRQPFCEIHLKIFGDCISPHLWTSLLNVYEIK